MSETQPDPIDGLPGEGDIMFVTMSDASETLTEVTEKLVEAYELDRDLGDRALIMPNPTERAPMLPFGSLSPVFDPGWADNQAIAEILERAHQRERIFARGESPPQLIVTKDRHHNPGYGYEGERDLLAVVRQKRRHWYVVTGDRHPAGGREQLSRHDTYMEAMTAAKLEARRFPPLS